MIKVSIIGSGNVAQHLITAFKEIQNSSSKLELVQVYSRKVELNPSTRPKPNC
jgi:malate/lactate dehydrogenase